ncbi:MAG: GHKL domain-containing protein [Oscillospiraceae bacterium]|nr:GHKL domain-containing protein [Oscillospiraceae bacterium]
MWHVLFLIFTVLKYPASLVGAWFWERTSRRFLAVKPGKLAYFVRLMLFWAGLVGPMWIGDENLLFFLLAFIGLSLLCYQGTWAARMVVSTVFYLFLSGTGMILDTAFNFLPSGVWDWSESINSVVKALAAVFVYLLARKLNPNEKAIELSGRLWGLCALLSLAPLIMVLSFSLWNSFGREQMDLGQYRIAYTMLPFVFLSALALLLALAVLSRHEALEQTAKLAQMRALYYDGLQSGQTQVRILRHDLRNHLGAVQGLLAQGETEKAQKYLAELTASPALHGAKHICENELANVVFSCKLEEMERSGLLPDVLVTLPKELSIADTDLCALLGNALDNATEAGKNAQDKKITVRARADRGMLMLRVKNSFRDTPITEGRILITSKFNTNEHGFGIRGMQEIATRYGGTLETSIHENQFELVACLPLPPSSAGSI